MRVVTGSGRGAAATQFFISSKVKSINAMPGGRKGPSIIISQLSQVTLHQAFIGRMLQPSALGLFFVVHILSKDVCS